MTGECVLRNSRCRPAEPIFGDLISGPNAGEVTIIIKTAASGVDNPSQAFWFVITPVLDGVEGDSMPYLFLNYQSGTSVTIVVSGLEDGENYKFNATSLNFFGSSEPVTSTSVLAGNVCCMHALYKCNCISLGSCTHSFFLRTPSWFIPLQVTITQQTLVP